MSERTYQLMEKMYVEMQLRFAKIEEKMATKDELRAIEERMATKHDIVRMEDKMDRNFGALFDGHTVTSEKLDRLEEKIDRIEEKVEIHDVEIRAIKGTAGN